MPQAATMNELPASPSLEYAAAKSPLFDHSAYTNLDDSDEFGTDETATRPDWRWSTSTFGYDPRQTQIFSDFGSEHDGSDEEDYVAEFQMARHIAKFGRSAFNLAPRSAINLAMQQNASPMGTHSNGSRAHLRNKSSAVPRQAAPRAPHNENCARATSRRVEIPSAPPPPLPPKSRLRASQSAYPSSPIAPIVEGELYNPRLALRGTRAASEGTVNPSVTSPSANMQRASLIRTPVQQLSPTDTLSVDFSRDTLSRNTTALSFGSASSKESQLRPRTPSSSFSDTTHSSSHTLTDRKTSTPGMSDDSPLMPILSDRHAPPPADVMREVDQYLVYNEENQPATFGSLYPRTRKNPNGPAPRLIAFFVRVLYCGVCQDYVRESVSTLDRAALDQANVSVVVVTHDNPEGVKGYRKSLNCPFPVYSDPTCGLYSLFNFRTKLVRIGENKAKYSQTVLPLQMARGFMRTMVHFPQGMGGNVKQLGGEVIIGPGGKCQYIHRTIHPRDHMDAADIARAAGCVLPIKTKTKTLSDDDDNERKENRALEAPKLATPNRPPVSRSCSENVALRETSTVPRPPRELNRRRHQSNVEVWRRPECASPDQEDYGNARDMTLYRFLAEYLESSERLDRFSAFPTASARPDPNDDRCDLGAYDLAELYGNGYQSASGYKAAIQEKYATAAAARRQYQPERRHARV